ncbi:MAG: hypothetical protein ACKO7Q_07650, partial [Actinomycetota bacterium]
MVGDDALEGAVGERGPERVAVVRVAEGRAHRGALGQGVEAEVRKGRRGGGAAVEGADAGGRRHSDHVRAHVGERAEVGEDADPAPLGRRAEQAARAHRDRDAGEPRDAEDRAGPGGRGLVDRVEVEVGAGEAVAGREAAQHVRAAGVGAADAGVQAPVDEDV